MLKAKVWKTKSETMHNKVFPAYSKAGTAHREWKGGGFPTIQSNNIFNNYQKRRKNKKISN